MAVHARHRLPQPSRGGGPQSTLPVPLVHGPRQYKQQLGDPRREEAGNATGDIRVIVMCWLFFATDTF